MNRRELLHAVGGLSVGTVVGLFLDPDELIMVQTADGSAQQAATTPAATATETEPATDTPTEEETPTESATDADTPAEQLEGLFTDHFSDGEFLNQWEYVNSDTKEGTELEESGSRLHHVAPASYNAGWGNIVTQQSFESTGTVRITARFRTNQSDYNGYGVGIWSEDGGVTLKEHKWEGFDRFAAFGVADRPEKYASDNDTYGEQTHKAKFASAMDDTDYVTYSMTIDLDSTTLTRVRRGDEEYDPSLDIGDVSDRFRLRLGAGGGHDVEYDYVQLERL